jgi:hypothetical protein
MFSEFVKILDSRNFLLGFFSTIFLILPGVLIIFLFDRNLFLELDWIKLILLSASITAPLVFLNFMIISYLDKVTLSDNKQSLAALAMSCIFTGFIILLSAVYGYFVRWTMGQVVILVCLANVFFNLIILYESKK